MTEEIEQSNLELIAQRYAAALSASDKLAGAESEDRPTATDIWLWKLEEVVWGIVEHPSKRAEPEGEYDHFWLYSHQDKLRTEEDVRNASDDVLLEALGLPNVENWGWLHFIVRELNWVFLLAANWGLPGMRGEFGGNDGATAYPTEDERRAQAAFYFLDLMRERGSDPLAELRATAQAIMEEHKIGEDKFIKLLRERDEWAYFVYTCESTIFRPASMGEPGEVKYSGEHRVEFLAEIRQAAARRRQHSSVSVN